MHFMTDFFWDFDIRGWFCDFPTQGSVEFLNKFCFESSSCHLWPWPQIAPWVSKLHVHICEVERSQARCMLSWPARCCWSKWMTTCIPQSQVSLSLSLTCPKLRPVQRNACWGWHILWPQLVAGWTRLVQGPAPAEQVEQPGGRAGGG